MFVSNIQEKILKLKKTQYNLNQKMFILTTLEIQQAEIGKAIYGLKTKTAKQIKYDQYDRL